MKIIKNITHEVITYIDEFGKKEFVDFKKCNEGWIQYAKRTNQFKTEDSRHMDDRHIGQRDLCAKPCFLEFFTYPKFTKFEFEKTDKCPKPEELFTKLKNAIIDAGWNTIDLS